MAWTRPQYERQVINKAARTVLEGDSSTDEYWNALTIVNNWRSSHSFPLNTMQVGLRAKATQIDGTALVAQRIKRLASITAKLERFPEMKLTQMQDLGGCRAVVSSVKAVNRLFESYRQGKHKHKLNHVDDYIASPKPSGYRGVHLIYKYYSDRNDTYNDLKIEVQLLGCCRLR
jgi:ppGpp synthetase/RelA/SpoT-type nucleotidyltranferase